MLQRLIAADRDAVAGLDLRTEFRLEPAWEAPLEGGEALSAWKFYVADSPARATRSGGIDLAPLRPLGAKPAKAGEPTEPPAPASRYLTWNGSLKAGSLDALRFGFRHPLSGPVELYWNGAGQDFGPQRYLLQAPDPDDPRRVTFELGRSRGWSGTVARVGLRLLGEPRRGQALTGAQGLRYLPAPDVGGGETRFASLDGRGMPAWIARPGLTLRRAVTIPPRAHLRLQAAPWLAAGQSVRIRVVARSRSGESVLIDRTLVPSETAPFRRWTRLVADLGALAGEKVEIRFETGAAPPGSLVLWGNPRVVGRAKEHHPNVVLISLDTVRADHLSLYGYPRPTTPNLQTFAAKWATVFETAVASAPWTLPSHVSILSGVEAVRHGVNRHGPIPPELPLLPQRFRDAGYLTYATTAGVLLTPEMGFARGFDELDVRSSMESLSDWDEDLRGGLDDALGWLERHPGQRFFLFFHTFEAHTPYQAREPWFSQFGGARGDLHAGEPVWMEEAGFEDVVRPRHNLFLPPTYGGGTDFPKRVLDPGDERDRKLAAALYDSGLAYVDSQLGRLFRYLEETERLDDTIVVVTSDHGESLFEHGLAGHSSLYDHDLLVPLVIAAPFREARGRRVAPQVRSVDLAPTLLQLAGLPPLRGIDGRSLIRLMHGLSSRPRDAWSYALSTVRGVSLRSASGRKAIAQDTIFEPFRGGLEVYDLRRDPGEAKDVAPAAPAEREGLRRHLLAGVRSDESTIEIRITNPGKEPLRGIVAGNVVDAMIVSPDLTFSCCAATSEGVTFVAPPGAAYTLRLPGRRAAGWLKLVLEEGRGAWKTTFQVDGSPLRHRIVRAEGRWSLDPPEIAAGPEGWTGLEVRRQGPRGGPATREGDPALRDKLRALGYVR